MAFRDRIKDFRRVPAKKLQPHPKNWRVHGETQKAALRGLLTEIGYADACIARELPDGTLQLLDGHMRADESPKQKIPVLIVDLTDEEAEKFVLTKDPLSSLAETDPEKLSALAAEVETQSEALRALIDSLVPDEEEEDSEPRITPVKIDEPETMTWVLIGIPTVRFGEVADLVDRLIQIPNIAFETAGGQVDSEDD